MVTKIFYFDKKNPSEDDLMNLNFNLGMLLFSAVMFWKESLFSTDAETLRFYSRQKPAIPFALVINQYGWKIFAHKSLDNLKNQFGPAAEYYPLSKTQDAPSTLLK